MTSWIDWSKRSFLGQTRRNIEVDCRGNPLTGCSSKARSRLRSMAFPTAQRLSVNNRLAAWSKVKAAGRFLVGFGHGQQDAAFKGTIEVDYR